jgi:hypothetical protein
MLKRIRNYLALIIGFGAGSLFNTGVLEIGSKLIPAPQGVDIANLESIKSHMHLYQPKHFLFPLLAHGLGTFISVCVCLIIANTQYPKRYVLGIASCYFFIGLSMILMMPSPLWFNLLDLTLAYFPMAFLGYQLAIKKSESVA